MINLKKIIHYCWFGKNPKSKLIQKCIDSWRKYCPDYEIKEWNEENFDINCCDYVREAYEAQKWAFVSDYCRFYVLYNYGGIYLDTDVELLRNLNSLERNFVGFEDSNNVASGLIRGAEKGDYICQLMLKSYNNDKFFNSNGTLNLTTVCDRETNILCELGLRRNNKLQVVLGTTVYPSEYFQPTNKITGRICLTSNAYSIHHYAASWVSKNDRMRGKIAKWFYRMFGTETANKIRKVFGRKR